MNYYYLEFKFTIISLETRNKLRSKISPGRYLVYFEPVCLDRGAGAGAGRLHRPGRAESEDQGAGLRRRGLGGGLGRVQQQPPPPPRHRAVAGK